MGHYFTNDESLKSEIKKTQIKIGSRDYSFSTDNGVFAKKGLDLGTHILLDSLELDQLHGRILDFGCGYGPIGIFIKKEVPTVTVDMVDINQRCLKLARENAKANGVDVTIFESDIYANVDGVYDFIISNPPIRVGKKILYQILEEAYDHLVPNGELWIVIHKDQGAKTTAKFLEKDYKVEIKNKSKGFFIIKAVKD